jgi:hypothetical protein
MGGSPFGYAWLWSRPWEGYTTELISLKTAPIEFRIALVREMGYDVDSTSTFVLRADGSPLLDEYANVQVRLDNMMILPGSAIILDDNPLSVASYFEDHGDIL